MSDPLDRPDNKRTSRQRYLAFVQDYKQGRLYEKVAGGGQGQQETNGQASAAEGTPGQPRPNRRGKRREYFHHYLRWLRPHRYRVGALFLLALVVAGLEMIEPLFMRFIIDRVLLNDNLTP